jgi:hypothetical protein
MGDFGDYSTQKKFHVLFSSEVDYITLFKRRQ